MSDPQPQVDVPRFESSSEQSQRTMFDAKCSLPAWNRERLIGQFQRIDGSTRGEAERLVADFERIFRRRMEEAPDDGSNVGPTPGNRTRAPTIA